jgi:hypothetical protein
MSGLWFSKNLHKISVRLCMYFKTVIRVNLETCDELRSGMPESGQKLFMSPQQSGAYGFIDKVTLVSSVYCTSRIF